MIGRVCPPLVRKPVFLIVVCSLECRLVIVPVLICLWLMALCSVLSVVLWPVIDSVTVVSSRIRYSVLRLRPVSSYILCRWVCWLGGSRPKFGWVVVLIGVTLILRRVMLSLVSVVVLVLIFVCGIIVTLIWTRCAVGLWLRTWRLQRIRLVPNGARWLTLKVSIRCRPRLVVVGRIRA